MTTGVAMPSAVAALSGLFQTFGLPSTLSAWAWKEVQGGKTEDEVLLDLYQRPEFKARFPGIGQREKNGLPPISPAEYVSYENSVSQALSAAGMPRFMWQKGDYFNNAITNLIGANKSVDEVVTNINDGLAKATSAPPEVQHAFSELFGTQGPTALASLYLDPSNTPVQLQRMYTEANVLGTGRRFGIEVSHPLLSEIAGLDPTASDVQQGLAQVGQQAGLFHGNVGEAGNLTAGDTGVRAAFGVDAAAQQAIQQRVEERVAGTKGTAAAPGEHGVAGLGTSTGA